MTSGETEVVNGRKRKATDPESPSSSTTPVNTRTLRQYHLEEKLEIIQYAKQNGNRAAGREFNVAESSIREWRKNEEKLKAMSANDPQQQLRLGFGIRRPGHYEKFIEPLQDMQVIKVPLQISGFPEFPDALSDEKDTSQETLFGHELSFTNYAPDSCRSSSDSKSTSNSNTSSLESPVENSYCNGVRSVTGSAKRKNKVPRKFIPNPDD
ncbi:hypothetical protein WR25_16450 [Diploscapter pachys]|uniref:HTH psq-type domain-containing protein n=1 Tax=Diploscapter pachys TaxID=2018661 RepID=A0A2A2L1G7_9BILA|nr:hypothetical protein WR25_16450 [Diploscapter pachys]